MASPYLPYWIGSNTATGSNPGDGSGFIFEKDSLNPKCPHAVSNWNFIIEGSSEKKDDPTFQIKCVVGKLY